jgi:hypothetical protein
METNFLPRSPLPAVVTARSTLLMGFITYFGVVSLYAQPTSVHMGWLNRDSAITREDRRWMKKYRRRGYNVCMGARQLDDVLGPHDCGVSPQCSWTMRSLFDEGVEVHKFDSYAQTDTAHLLEKLSPWFVWRLATEKCTVDGEAGAGFSATPDNYVRF